MSCSSYQDGLWDGRQVAIQDLFKAVRSILVSFTPSLFSKCFVRSQMVQPYNSTDTATSWKNSSFILSERLDFHMLDNLSIAAHDFPMRILTSLSVDEILLSRYRNWFTNFRDLPINEELAPSWLQTCTLFYLRSRRGQYTSMCPIYEARLKSS